MAQTKTLGISSGLVSRLVALETDQMPQSEVVPFLQEIVDAGATKAMPYSIQNLIRMYSSWGDVTEPGQDAEGEQA